MKDDFDTQFEHFGDGVKSEIQKGDANMSQAGTTIEQSQNDVIGATHFIAQVDLFIAGFFAVLVFAVFVRGFKYARFTTHLTHVFRAIGETVTYLVIPNQKGVEFIDKVVVTPFMRLNVFGLNEGFVKIGEIFNAYFTHGARVKQHAIVENILPRLDEVAIVISAFQTKQILIHGSRIMISLSIMSLLFAGLLHAPTLLFYDYIVGSFFGGEHASMMSKDMMIVGVIVFVSLLVMGSYVWKIIDDVIYIMRNQQDVDDVEFRKFIIDNLSLLVARGSFIDAEIARDAEKYVLATFFEVQR